MKWKEVEQIAKSLAGDQKKQFYLNQAEVSRLLGRDPRITGEFLLDAGVPYYLIGRAKMYFLPEILEAVEKTRWRTPV